ncbi:MAG: PhzF family phenazine biosynthesis protein [Pseudohongiellaceae bacterium]|nr:PhzF family phenazine biosynthesis protein [Pseudohongiellaceae bacterium]
MNHYYIVDVFTDKAFNGAQIAVFPEASELNEGQMQLIARELNFSDTVFVQPKTKSDYKLKVFTPNDRRNFSGHATLAAAYVLGKSSLAPLQEKHTSVTMEQNESLTHVVISQQDDDLFIQFSRKSSPVVDRYVPNNHELAASLSLEERDISKTPYNTLLVSCDQPFLIVPLTSFEAVRKAQFNFKQWSSSVAPISAATEILLFSTKSDLKTSNFHGRIVGPQIGIDEDPPIGAAMPAFTGFLNAQGHVRPGTYSFVIDRGTVTTRKSVLSIEMVNQKGKENEIRVGGPAVLVGEGKIASPSA